MKRAFFLRIVVFGALFTTSGIAQQYKAANVSAPSNWKTQPPWQQAVPSDSIPKGAWWEIYRDAELNGYEQQLLKSNQSLLAARDRLEQARAFARIATSAMFPQGAVDPGGQRQRISANRPLNGAQPPLTSVSQSVYNIPFAVSYEVDLFGRVRQSVAAANAQLQASAADLQNAQLVLSAELAADYFSLRELDSEVLVVKQLIGYEQKGLELVQNRERGGIASGLEVAQQKSLLDATLTQLSLVDHQRDQFEHAIAVLTGNPASGFSVPVEALNSAPPPVPLGVPSELIERRPDIASAERMMAYQNAQVGVAKAAFFPHITLTGGAGFQSRDLANLISGTSLIWAVGGDVLQSVFSGGRNRANLAQHRAAYNESIDNYREVVLESFQQVEDGLSGLNTLSNALATQQAAVEDTRRAMEIANNRYIGGLATYLDVITAQSALLANERLAAQIQGQQMVTSVFLVKALGGNWERAEIQKEQVHPKATQAIQP